MGSEKAGMGEKRERGRSVVVEEVVLVNRLHVATRLGAVISSLLAGARARGRGSLLR
jgi:hypothetical protein